MNEPARQRTGFQPVVLLDDLPEYVAGELYVLTLPETVSAGDVVELCRTLRGPAAIAYTSLANLAAACGTSQPWARATTRRLQGLGAEHGYNLVILDAWLPDRPRPPDVDVREQPDLEPAEYDGEDPLLYVPSRPVHVGQQTVHVELQPDPAGRLMVLAYTSPEQLAERCGRYQPWVAIHRNDLAQVAEQAGAHGVLFEPVLDEGSRHTGPVRNWSSRSIASQTEGHDHA
ncbi:SAV_915 family protein [Amycolatopsis cihanbeyliensis]|uniref:Type III secretion system (T3SS) SseB-like protein n=1 Tax=Amycolatopsis cihanbeyliensis TaxID=1128664 RepID=A0A542DEE7_AMYCI|nr:SAV_915 family protein [Amycolatopsis cihanbeyliensis]TQJ01443.1 type III secretion system (T3SS) SseB-like protein [Amycolatopsis cihanbeyliensis]